MGNKTYTNCLPADFWNKTLRECRNENCLDAYAMLARGFWTCENKDIKGRILLTGINPSYNGLPFDSEKMIESTPFAQLVPCEKRNGFWHNKAKQFGNLWKDDIMSYLDLFPIRESDQSLFEIAFKELADLRRTVLEVTQVEIESMKPKLIVHANKNSIYYWGIKKDTPIEEDAIDKENPWMGYMVKRVTEKDYPKLPECLKKYNRLELFPLYEIVGFQENEKRINQKDYPESSSLEGSFLMEYVMDGRNKKYNGKLYQEKENGPKEWTEIWNWVKDLKQ